MISWLLGGIEVCLTVHFFGIDIGIGPGFIIESLGQALKAVGFAVPGAIGVQEGGYVVVCRLLGIGPRSGDCPVSGEAGPGDGVGCSAAHFLASNCGKSGRRLLP